MTQCLLHHEGLVRLCFFFGVFTLMAAWEIVAPKRALTRSKTQRWVSNWCLVVFNSILLRLVFPFTALLLADFVWQRQWGLMHFVYPPLAVFLSLLILDLIIYLQHVLMHALPLLWRIHRVHHTDPDFDVTTGSRFHPLEILISMGIKFAAIILIGPPVLAVLIFEVVLNAMSMFNHGNVRLISCLERSLRCLLVTPDMHRVHHSVLPKETNSNFGFNLSLWDRLFGTYQARPKYGHEAMTVGLEAFQSEKYSTRLKGLLILPFVGQIAATHQDSGDENS